MQAIYHTLQQDLQRQTLDGNACKERERQVSIEIAEVKNRCRLLEENHRSEKNKNCTVFQIIFTSGINGVKYTYSVPTGHSKGNGGRFGEFVESGETPLPPTAVEGTVLPTKDFRFGTTVASISSPACSIGTWRES